MTVAVLDTGINAGLEEFSGRLAPGYDFVNRDANPNDDNGHGTGRTRLEGVADPGRGGVRVAWQQHHFPGIDVRMALVHIGDFSRIPHDELAFIGFFLPHDHSEDGSFTRPVGANNANYARRG